MCAVIVPTADSTLLSWIQWMVRSLFHYSRCNFNANTGFVWKRLWWQSKSSDVNKGKHSMIVVRTPLRCRSSRAHNWLPLLNKQSSGTRHQDHKNWVTNVDRVTNLHHHGIFAKNVRAPQGSEEYPNIAGVSGSSNQSIDKFHFNIYNMRIMIYWQMPVHYFYWMNQVTLGGEQKRNIQGL